MPPAHEMPVLVRTGFREQSDIGWDHFIQGRMSMTWGELIKRQLEIRSIKNQKAEQWGTDLISIHWKNILNMWNQRSIEVSGSTEEEKQERRKRILNQSKKTIQQKYPDFPQSSKDLIDASEDALAELMEVQLIAYLHGAKTITKIHTKP
jgi:hypothetical protein